MEQLLQVGVITQTHGVHGEVKVFPTTDDPERFLDLEYVFLDTGREKKKADKPIAIYYSNNPCHCGYAYRNYTSWQL